MHFRMRVTGQQRISWDGGNYISINNLLHSSIAVKYVHVTVLTYASSVCHISLQFAGSTLIIIVCMQLLNDIVFDLQNCGAGVVSDMTVQYKAASGSSCLLLGSSLTQLAAG